jgi:putative endonuclease
MITQKRSRGNLGEREAEKFLKSRGFKVLERNYYNKFGEIDLICQRGNRLHFVEVKTSFTSYNPAQNMTKNKMFKILKTANLYIIQKGLLDISIFFDLVTVNFNHRTVSLYPNINIDFS